MNQIIHSTGPREGARGRRRRLGMIQISPSLPRLSVIGLGKLGSPMAACFAAHGFQVAGADIDPAKVEAINQGRAPVCETDLQHYLDLSRGRITATRDTAEAVDWSDVTFLIVPTPSDPEGGFSLRSALPACESVGLALRRKTDFHVVVMTSTVMPGSTDGPIRATLEEVSGKVCGRDFGLCYSPEFIALGSVIHNFLNPDMILIGESDTRSGDILEAIYRRTCDNQPHFARMSCVNAELTKLAVNTYITTKITFANLISRLCEKLPGGDVDVVTAALGADSRIGAKYLKGATGYGGPCFPRDNRALAFLARQAGTRALIAEATDRMNQEEIHRLTALVKSHVPRGGTVGILGLAYKPDTDVVEESQGLFLAHNLSWSGYPVVAYDPLAMENAARVLSHWPRPLESASIRFAGSARECVAAADLVVIATPWKGFQNLQPGDFARGPGPARVVIDCWRMLDSRSIARVAEYHALGLGPSPIPEIQALQPEQERVS